MWFLWINLCGSDAYHEVHKIICTMKISIRIVSYIIIFDETLVYICS